MSTLNQQFLEIQFSSLFGDFGVVRDFSVVEVRMVLDVLVGFVV